MFNKINKVIKSIIYWEFIINAGWGLLSPVFAIFILENVAQGNVAEGAKIVGFAALFYWFTKVIFQLPIAHYLDKNHGEIDDFWFFFTGTFITGLVPLGFIFSSMPWHIYLLQIIHAMGMSMVTPSNSGIFIRHIDKGKEAFEAGLDNTLVGVAVGIAGAVGGIIASTAGFMIILLGTSIFTLLAAFSLLFVRKEMAPKVSRQIDKLPSYKFEEASEIK